MPYIVASQEHAYQLYALRVDQGEPASERQCGAFGADPNHCRVAVPGVDLNYLSPQWRLQLMMRSVSSSMAEHLKTGLSPLDEAPEAGRVEGGADGTHIPRRSGRYRRLDRGLHVICCSRQSAWFSLQL
ncbi:hypothetical protein D9M68_372150 [compost metagenome]